MCENPVSVTWQHHWQAVIHFHRHVSCIQNNRKTQQRTNTITVIIIFIIRVYFRQKLPSQTLKIKTKIYFFKLDRQVVRFSNNNLGKIILNNKVHFQEKINNNTVPNKNTAKDMQNEGFGDRKSEKPNARVGFCCIRVKAVGEHIVMNHELSHSRHCQILQTQIRNVSITDRVVSIYRHFQHKQAISCHMSMKYIT